MPMSNSPQWQPWQPESLLPEAPLTAAPDADTAPSETQIHAELARTRKHAEQQGFQQGLAQGKEAGHPLGYEAGLLEGREAGLAEGLAQSHAQQQAVLSQAESWLTAFSVAMDNLNSLIPSRLVQLSLAAAQQVYGGNVLADNPALLAQIRSLMQQDALLQGAFQLSVHPDDRTAVMEAMGDALSQAGWTLHSDAQLAPGGCRIASTEREFDATLEARWQALCQLARQELGQ